jgi:fucose 4-O-acetylase-like acetyltransferase
MSLFTTRERLRLCAILGVAIACAAPLVSQLDWSGVPAPVKQYIAPDLAAFGFFPWAAFLAFGMSAGSILRLAERDDMNRVMQWTAITGFALVLAGQYFGNLPYSLYRNSDFWLNSPALVFIKLGAILLGLCFAYLWTTHAAPQGWSWVRQLGTTSLLVYWLHTELVYGRWLGFWKEKLSIGQTAVLAVMIIAVMLGLSFIKTLLQNWRQSTGPMAYPAPEVPRVSGD